MRNLDMLLIPQQLDKEITVLQMRRTTLRALLERTVTTIQLAPGHGNGVRRRDEEIIAEIDEIERLIEAKAEERDEIIIRCQAMLSELDDRVLVSIMEMRYLTYAKWSDIAELTGYSTRYVYKLHRKALSELAKK